MNTLTEGKERLKAPDKDGVLTPRPGTSIEDLKAEVANAAQLLAAGDKAGARTSSSIASRADLVRSAVNEARLAAPEAPAKISVDKETARAWADLDAADLGRLRKNREAGLATIAGNARTSPEYAEELKARSPVIADAASRINELVRKEEADRADQVKALQRAEVSATEAASRLAAIDEAALSRVAVKRQAEGRVVSDALGYVPEEKAPSTPLREPTAEHDSRSPGGAPTAPPPSKGAEAEEEQKRLIKRPIQEEELPLALRDRYIVSSEKSGLTDKGRTEFSFRGGAMDGVMAFQDTGKQLLTPTEDKAVVKAMVEVAAAKGWREVTVSGTDEFRRSAWLEARINGLEVHGYEPREADKKRLAELRRVDAPTNAITTMDREAQRADPSGDDVEAMRRRLVGHLQSRAVFTIEEESKFREAQSSGNKEAQAQIREAAELRSERDIQAVRSLGAKELKELDQLYKGPASADAQRKARVLLDGAAKHQPSQAIKPQKTVTRPDERSVHVDGDALSTKEKATLEAMKLVLQQRQYGPEFVEQTLVEVENKMRRQRVHVGELMEHGAARYKGDEKNDMSYFVTLKTASGVETVWGKELGGALEKGGVKVGDQIVLANTGKKPVTVLEKEAMANGQTKVNWKDAKLNEWSAAPIDRLSSRDKIDVTRNQGKEPTLQVYDSKAERTRSATPSTEREREHARGDRGLSRGGDR